MKLQKRNGGDNLMKESDGEFNEGRDEGRRGIRSIIEA